VPVAPGGRDELTGDRSRLGDETGTSVQSRADVRTVTWCPERGDQRVVLSVTAIMVAGSVVSVIGL
jgi:hypothetical protein